MKKTTELLLKDLVSRYPSLKGLSVDLEKTVSILVECHKADKKILICGNGGSAADSEHISGELLKGFMLKRSCDENDKKLFEKYGEDGERLSKFLQHGIKAIPLPSLSSAMTAYMNDMDSDLVYAQLTFALGGKADVLLAISTSGNSKNTYFAILVAKSLGMKTIGLTGKLGGKMNELCDVCIKAPEDQTYRVQELHLPIYHFLCLALEEEIFGSLE